VLCACIESPAVTEQSCRKDNVWAHTKLPLLDLLYINTDGTVLDCHRVQLYREKILVCVSGDGGMAPEEWVMLILPIIKYFVHLL
jgi:hypothetical protein